MSKLYCFDFDDSIATTDARIKLTNKNKSRYLTPHEFADYKQQPGDVFDYSEFRGELRNPQIIEKYFEVFKKIFKAVGDKLVILTARGDAAPIHKFLALHGLTGINIVALGASNSPQEKKDWIEKQIINGTDDILFMDDSIENVMAVRSLKEKYPKIKLDARVIKQKH